MRVTIAILGFALALGCAAKDGGANGTGTDAGDGSDTDYCPIGTLNCPCSHGGSCILGLTCEDGICVPAPDTGTDGSSDSDGGSGTTTPTGGTESGTGTGGTGSGSTGSTSTSAGTTMTFTTIEDTFVQGGAPDLNTGANVSLSVHWTPLIPLVGFDVAAIDDFVAGGAVLSASLRFEISSIGAGWGPEGNDIYAYRMNVHWTEDGATFNCAIDTGYNDGNTDCAGPTAWNMDGPDFPHAGTPSDAVTIVENQSGFVTFDVTADVQAFAAGTANEGWAIRKGEGQPPGSVSFHSREGDGAPAVLSITIE